jgi:salicylate hydroxylase
VLAAFDHSRRERSQWLVQSSRWIGDCYEWQAKGIGRDVEKVEAEINERIGIISNYDIEKASADAREEVRRSLAGSVGYRL